MEKYTKIDTIYKRYQFSGDQCPNKKWMKFRNKIILGEFSNKEAQYLFNCPWEAYSKIDGTNSKIAFFPSTGEIRVGGKTDNADNQQGQFEFLQEIADRIKSQLCAMFPPESAKFAPACGADNKPAYYYPEVMNIPEGSLPVLGNKVELMENGGDYMVELEEVPVYIYGEYFGKGIQKVGGRYIKDGHSFAVFDVRVQGWWTPKEYRDEFCQKLGLERVPFIGIMTLNEIENMVMKGFTTKVAGVSDPTLLEEGIVARPTIPLNTGRNNRVIVKVKYCDYIEYITVRNEFTDEEFNEFDKWYHQTIETNQ